MQDPNLSQLQATIASFRYWVPSVSDVARVEQDEVEGVWRLAVRPLQPGACPFALTLSRNGRYGVVINGVTHGEQAIESLDLFLPMVEAITDGQVVQRRWSSANTGIETRIDTIIEVADGRAWSGTSSRTHAGTGTGQVDETCRERHFLPYRRR